MKQSGPIFALALLLAAMVGAAGYLGVSALLVRGGGRAAPAPDAAVRQVETAALRSRLAEMERRLARLEARPDLRDQLAEDGTRRQLAELLGDAVRRDREAEERKQAEERIGRVIGWYRDSYRQLLAEARVEIKAEEDAWAKLSPAFEKHFAALEKAIREKGAEGDARWAWTRVSVNDSVAPVLPETLAAVQGALSPELWRAFEEWRRKAEPGRFRATLRGDYFVSPDELRQARAQTAVERRWTELRQALPELGRELALDADKVRQLEALMRRHAEAFTAAFDGQPQVNVFDEGNLAKVRALAAVTDREVKTLLGDEAFGRYERWKKSPGSRVHMYFGEVAPRQFRHEQRQERPAPGGAPPRPPGGELF